MIRFHRLLFLSLAPSVFHAALGAERPHVIVIMSDDQGGGDYGFQGNPLIKTPQLDSMFERSGFLSNFYVSPVCAPTRASLLTGRYNYRTRCVDTYVGRAMMDSDEVTLAEFLRDCGYQTGIFGKWHLGDNYPLRAQDQGFQESLVLRGGGIGQPSDPVGAEGKYTDPTLMKNGMEVRMKGYCTDIYFDAAMDFLTKTVQEKGQFFAYIATNAPHDPFHDVPLDLYEEYRNVDFSPIVIGKHTPEQQVREFDNLARIAAMITNIDENVGRLFERLDTLGIRENTIVVYLNDNGPNSRRYVGEMRGMKSDVDDGGIRSPLLFHWPARVDARAKSEALCAHIDLLPTILDACGVQVPDGHRIDGRSFLPLLANSDSKWPPRQVVFQTHRGDTPQRYHHFAIHEDPWKLVHPSGFAKERFAGEPKLQLYDLRLDPRQRHDVSGEFPEVVQRLKSCYDTWFDDVSSTRTDNFAPPRIVIGTPHEKMSVLTRQNWRHVHSKPWASESNGYWLLEAPEPGDYELEVILESDQLPSGTAIITAGSLQKKFSIRAGARRGHVARIQLPAGELKLAVEMELGDIKQGPYQVVLTRK